MKSRRTAKVSEAIRQVVSSAILIELRDPRVKNVTVLHVDTSADLRTAKVYVSILGDEKAERLSMQGLDASRGWLQSKIADQLQLRLTPVLTFISDPGIKKSVEVSKMLREISGEPLSDEDSLVSETLNENTASTETEDGQD
ncbi:30S ribosome-binding factor RbfA [Planctomicrobium sp.]|jgi:ribosome-binding factor A|nr:30S ribosome-binding factor RbfA [Planctomicrobium sp.]MBT5018158.1 30S ribosome-binding factor RbfA [Planctomicrobium sp.]MDB4439442.1 30S ribosome-binding factor RbfA [Planctomicrobium sp.]MDB4733053.1 30S ribosome-binding factor RbfA [Planctomicrobium sp.]MDB4743723.1 30S ribosome-binding factor RbfA [Planctomicrobium sp.]